MTALRPFLTPFALLFALAALLAPVSHGETITSHTLSYQPAGAIIEQVQALFPEQEVRLSGMQNQIIIRARNESLANEIKQLISQLDQRPHQFRITLRQQGERLNDRVQYHAGGTVSQRSSTVQITAGHGTLNRNGQSQQVVTVLENNAVAIQQGQLRPIRDFWVSRHGVASSTRFQSVGNALVLTPRRLGTDQVELSVHARHASENDFDRERVDQLELVTQRIVPFGEWVELGSTSQNWNDRREGVTHYSTRTEQELGSYEIKVELID